MRRIEMYDSLPPEEAVRRAWGLAGRSELDHRFAQEDLRKSMPLLGRALDRLVDSRQKS